MKILIVDDEPQILDILEDALEEKFLCQVDRAENGLDAFLLCRENKYNFIITDYKMPYMSGAALVMALKTRQNLNVDTNCLMLTAYLTNDLKKKINLDHVEFLSKPMQLDQVIEVVTPHLN